MDNIGYEYKTLACNLSLELCNDDNEIMETVENLPRILEKNK